MFLLKPDYLKITHEIPYISFQDGRVNAFVFSYIIF